MQFSQNEPRKGVHHTYARPQRAAIAPIIKRRAGTREEPAVASATVGAPAESAAAEVSTTRFPSSRKGRARRETSLDGALKEKENRPVNYHPRGSFRS